MSFPTIQIDTYHELNSIVQDYSATAHQEKVSMEKTYYVYSEDSKGFHNFCYSNEYEIRIHVQALCEMIRT